MSTQTSRVRTRRYGGANPPPKAYMLDTNPTPTPLVIVDGSQVVPHPVHGLGIGAPWVTEELEVGPPLTQTLIPS